MPKVIIVVGLPGSGKTTYANMLAASIPTSQLFDDISLGDSAASLNNLVEALKLGYPCVVTDPSLCRPKTRAQCEAFLSLYATVEWVFFENNPEQCRINADRRGNLSSVESSIYVLSKVYEIPAGAKVFPVFGTTYDSAKGLTASAEIAPPVPPKPPTLWERIKKKIFK